MSFTNQPQFSNNKNQYTITKKLMRNLLDSRKNLRLNSLSPNQLTQLQFNNHQLSQPLFKRLQLSQLLFKRLQLNQLLLKWSQLNQPLSKRNQLNQLLSKRNQLKRPQLQMCKLDLILQVQII